MRIGSLLASATEIVCALGLDDQLVAISHECDFPARIQDRPRISRPRFDPGGLSSAEVDAAVRHAMAEEGSVYALDDAALRDAAPDLLLTQDVCEVCAVPTSLAERAAALLDRRPEILSLDAHSVGEILETIRLVASAAGVRRRGEEVVAGLRDRLGAVEAAVAGLPRPAVLALEWLDPPFVPGHWGPEMIALAGGRSVCGAPGERSRQVEWVDLEALDPDVLLVLPCGYDLARSRREADDHARRLAALAPRAVATGRAHVVDGSSYFNRSGPRVVDGVELLAALFHPERFPGAVLDGRATEWRATARSTASS